MTYKEGTSKLCATWWLHWRFSRIPQGLLLIGIKLSRLQLLSSLIQREGPREATGCSVWLLPSWSTVRGDVWLLGLFLPTEGGLGRLQSTAEPFETAWPPLFQKQCFQRQIWLWLRSWTVNQHSQDEKNNNNNFLLSSSQKQTTGRNWSWKKYLKVS